MKIGIVDSGGANLASIQFALDRIGSQSFVSSKVDQLIKADKLYCLALERQRKQCRPSTLTD